MAAGRRLAYALHVPEEHGVRDHPERLWAEPEPRPARHDATRVVAGAALVLVAAVGLLFAWWLNQPGFAGDPRVKLLDDGPFAVAALVLLAVGTAGVLLAKGRSG
jgi:hypothetical protein